MRPYVEKTINEFPGHLRNKLTLTPATGKLYEVRPGIPKLYPNKNQKFHVIVVQLL